MSYPMRVEEHHKFQYANNVTMVAQQLRNPLMGAVTEVTASGEAQSVADLVNSVRYMRGEAGARRNPQNPVSGSRRWVVLPDGPIESGDYITKEEKFKTATDPTSVYVRTHTAAVTRGWADTILGIDEPENGEFEIKFGGILGIAREGKTPGAGTPLPSSQFVPHGSTGLTLDKLRDAVKTLKKADFGIDQMLDPLFSLITPEQEDDLLGIAAASGVNLNTFNVEQLRSGKPTPLMGVTWILTNRLPLNSNGHRLVPIWSKANIIAGVWQGIEGDMWNDTNAKNLPYCYVSAYVDAVRAQDKGVIAIECVEP